MERNVSTSHRGNLQKPFVAGDSLETHDGGWRERGVTCQESAVIVRVVGSQVVHSAVLQFVTPEFDFPPKNELRNGNCVLENLRELVRQIPADDETPQRSRAQRIFGASLKHAIERFRGYFVNVGALVGTNHLDAFSLHTRMKRLDESDKGSAVGLVKQNPA